MPSRTARANERGSVALTVIGGAALVVGFVTAMSGVGPVLQPWSLADAAAGSSVVSSGLTTGSGESVMGSHDPATGTPTSIALSAPRGEGGARVAVSGEGFAAGERVVLRFDDDEVARSTADAHGRFAGVFVRVPDGYGAFAPATFTITATGLGSTRSSDAAFELVG